LFAKQKIQGVNRNKVGYPVRISNAEDAALGIKNAEMIEYQQLPVLPFPGFRRPHHQIQVNPPFALKK